MRTSHYAAESAFQPLASATAFGSTAQVNLARAGDLVHNMYVCLDIPAIELRETKDRSQPWVGANVKTCAQSDAEVFEAHGNEGKSVWRQQNYGGSGMDADSIDTEGDEAYCHWANAIGMLIIKQADLLIGGSCVDTLTSSWLWVYSELMGSAGRLQMESVGKRYQRYDLLADSSTKRRLYVHCPWFFSTDPGSALSLCSLAYHGITINFQWESLQNCVVVHIPKSKKNKNFSVFNCSTGQPLNDNDLQAQILTQYIYLSQEEREAFSNSDYEMLCVCHQRQVTSHQQQQVRIPLQFNHALLEMIWFVRRKCAVDTNAHWNFSGIDQKDPIEDATLTLNNQKRWSNQAPYFRIIVPTEVHSRVPDAYIYVWSWSLNPERWSQPSGSLNASRIDSIALELTMQKGLELAPFTVEVLARSYNIIRFRSGLAGLSYAN